MFGGLSATYYHEELIKYPCIDYVIRGDATEKLVLQLMNQLTNKVKRNLRAIPNLTWKTEDDYVINEHSYVATSIDEFDPGYRYVIRSVFKYLNFLDPLPYGDWLKYPNTAVLTSKGCTVNCLICGGARTAYKSLCGRKQIALRSPEKLEQDIKFIQRLSRAPIFVLNDIRQGGKAYYKDFLLRMKDMNVKNELVLELFYSANDVFFKEVNESVNKYSIEMTLETFDEELRRFNGKFNCSNEKVINTIKAALRNGCSKIDLFFMVGVPEQTYESAIKNVEFCEYIHKECGEDKRISYFIAPLAPFLDPGSPAFENPEKFGYIKLCNTLEDHRKAVEQPSWKHMLSYETVHLNRDQIVQATYESALALNEFKLKYGLIDKNTFKEVKSKIDFSLEFMDKIDYILTLPAEGQEKEYEAIRKKVNEVNSHSICGKDELKWEVKKHFANPLSLTWVGIELLAEELVNSTKIVYQKSYLQLKRLVTMLRA